MLDYHGSAITLSELSSTLSSTTFSNPAVAGARDDAFAAVSAEGGAALLGAFVHHLLAHAASDGAELALVERGAGLWKQGVKLCNELGKIRADLEKSLDDPGASGSADRFNNATVAAQKLKHRGAVLRVDIDAFRRDVLKFPHLHQHPRQRDLGTDGWDWGNLILGRRTDAFVRALLRRAGDKRTRAFAVGATAAYGAHAAGSAFLGHGVGGPRRSQRFRDRIARNTLGSWLAVHHPAATKPSAMAQRITFGPAGQPALPGPLASLLAKAIDDTFDLTHTAPVPDLQRGYKRLVEHLRLLDEFALPRAPTPPGQVWMAQVLSDPANPPPTLRPQDIDVTGQDGGGVAVQVGPGQPGSQTPSGSDSKDVQKGCGIVVALIILADLLQAFIQCIGQWANHHRCTFWDNMLLKKIWEQDPPDPHDPTGPQNPNVTAAKLTAAASSPQMAQLLWMLFEAHSVAWEAIDRAYGFLAVTGLIYPGHLLTMPLYAQFTTLPKQLPWPHREEPHPTETYHLYPTSPIEHPMRTASHFPGGPLSTATIRNAVVPPALRLWSQAVAGEHDSDNLDLDADRGVDHLCWATRGSINTDPVDVAVLGFNQQ